MDYIRWDRRKYSKEDFLREFYRTDNWKDLAKNLGLSGTGGGAAYLRDTAVAMNLPCDRYIDNRSRIKYTKKILQDAVDKSTSYSQVLRILGRRPVGGNITHISERIKYYDIDTQHFTGQAHKRGKKSVILQKPAEILILGYPKDPRVKRRVLLRCMLSLGVAYKCRTCGIDPIWNNKSLVLEINHINGNSWDNRLGNLEFLCPNCHSQEVESNRPHKYNTTRMGKDVDKIDSSIDHKEAKICKTVDCNIEIRSRSTNCQKHSSSRNTKINWPDETNLISMLKSSNYTQLSNILGVSDNAIRKRVRSYGYDTKTLLIV